MMIMMKQKEEESVIHKDIYTYQFPFNFLFVYYILYSSLPFAFPI